jgi:hypothetical protein
MKSNRMNMLDKSGTLIDIRTGNAVRIRRTWRAPQAGRLGVVSAIEPNDAYGAYLIELEDGLLFRYYRHELEPSTGWIRSLLSTCAWQVVWVDPHICE